MGSKSFSLNLTDVVGLLKNALLVAVAAFITAVVNGLAHLDLGEYTALIVPMVTVFLDTILKWVKNNAKDNGDDKVDPQE